MADVRFPIGHVVLPAKFTAAERRAQIARIAALPDKLFDAVRGLDEEQLDTRYRVGGWTLRQVVHHIADSHVQAYVRHKLTITEAVPTIQAYDEAAWAEMPDAQAPIGSSLAIVQHIHGRLAHALSAQPERVFANRCTHTTDGERTLDDLIATYAWHGEHHVAHITGLRDRKGW